MGKHDNKDQKINMKKIVILLLFIALVIFAIYYYFNISDNSENEIINELNTTFNYLKNDKEKAKDNIDYNLLITGLDDMILEENRKEIENELFKNIEWNIENIDIEKDTAVAIIEVKNKDYREILTKWMKEIISIKNKGKNISDKLALDKLQKIIKEENSIKTIMKKINLERMEDKWHIVVDNSFIELVYPGIDDVKEALNN